MLVFVFVNLLFLSEKLPISGLRQNGRHLKNTIEIVIDCQGSMRGGGVRWHDIWWPHG